MKKNSSNSDFNLFLSSDAVLGTLESIYEMMAEIPAESSSERTRWANALTGLAWAGLGAARKMNTFLNDASDMHRFPKDYSDIGSGDEGVKETAALYAIR